MFSTSVLECHKSLDQAAVKPVLSENCPNSGGRRPSWPTARGPGLFASGKENRPGLEEAKVTKGAPWQREAEARQARAQRPRGDDESQLRPSEAAELRRRCQDLERERDERAEAATRLEAQLKAQKAP